ncbi:MAG: YceD family protein [Aeromicrobium sp.]
MLSGPLVVDTHELGRRPGNERTINLAIAAPAKMGSAVFGVPEGSDIAIELRLEAVMDGVLATGTASTQATGECVRCLDDLDQNLVVDFQELFLYDESGEDELSLEGELLDLEPVLRDAVVLALPLNPVCDPECPGLCPECGARLADDPDHTHGDAIDPRWAKLSRMTDPDIHADIKE